MTFDSTDFGLDLSGMQQDLERVGRKPGEQLTQRSEKYLQLPKGEGSVTIRLLPGVKPNSKGLVVPYASTRLHYINGRGYHCLCEKHDGKWVNDGSCPICNVYNWLYKQVRGADNKDFADALVKKARDIKPIERHYYNCIVREEYDESGEKNTDVGPKIASFGKSQHSRILRAVLGDTKLKEKPIGNVFHPATGRDFKINKEIRKSDQGDFPNYDSSKFLDESVAGTDQQIKGWLENLYDLEAERANDLKSEADLKHQVDVFLGKAEDADTNFNQDDFEIPVDLAGMAPPKTTTSVSVPEQITAVTAPAPKPEPTVVAASSVTEEPPFDVNTLNIEVGESSGNGDVAMVEEDWVQDLEKVIKNVGD